MPLPAKRRAGALANNLQRNIYESYGAQMAGKWILKYTKGAWLLGREPRIIPAGTRVIVQVDELRIGHTKWQGGFPVDTISGLVSEGYVPPARETLGDLDESLWERDDNDNPKDPWAYGNEVPVIFVDSREPATLVTGSDGGLRAVGALVAAYGREIHIHPGCLPICPLGTGGYTHRKKSIGWVHTPVLMPDDWLLADGRLRSEVSSKDDLGDEVGI
jgi:hypothetical protein